MNGKPLRNRRDTIAFFCFLASIQFKNLLYVRAFDPRSFDFVVERLMEELTI